MSNKNPISEVSNKDWQLGVERTYVLLPEIFDTRISGNEIRLLLLLRYRASGRETNFVSYQTLAEDLSVHENSIKNWMKNLKNLGYVTCSSRGFAASSLKTIASMEERYDKDILLGDRKTLVGSKRTPEMLSRLQCKPPESPLAQEDVPMDSDTSHKYTCVYPTSTPACTPQVQEDVLEIDKEKLDKCEVDSTRFASLEAHQPEADSQTTRRVGFIKGDAIDIDTGEVLGESDSGESEETKGFASDSGKNKGGTAEPERGSLSDADGDTRRAAAVDIIPTVGLSAHRKAKEAIAKTGERKEAKEASGEAEKVREWKRATKAQTMTIKAQLEEFMTDTFRDWFPDAIMGKFGGPEYGKLNHLLKIYDDNIVFIRKAWKFLCEDWEEVQRRLKIKDSVPTIGIFLYFRESIFAMVQEVKTTRQEQESGKLTGKFEW